MDRRFLILVTLCIVASGCAESGSQGTGIQIEKLSVADNTLNPNQETTVSVEIRNYNVEPTEIKSENVELFNTGQVSILEKNCSPDTLGSARQDFSPTMACTWTIKAPGESYVKGFDSKPISMKMGMTYTSTLENRKAIKVDFRDMNDIDNSGEIRRSVTNGDITAVITGETPLAISNPQSFNIELKNTGPGSLQSGFTLEYTPQDIFVDCPTERDPIQQQAQVNCVLEAGSEGTRNVFISTSYKYQKSQNVGIEVVNN